MGTFVERHFRGQGAAALSGNLQKYGKDNILNFAEGW